MRQKDNVCSDAIASRQRKRIRYKTIWEVPEDEIPDYVLDEIAHVTSQKIFSSTDNIEGIISKLKAAIDELARNFANIKDLVLELARMLDETKYCEQRNQICRKIKQILKDKITERKITAKWIEKCLPSEYKRKYNDNKNKNKIKSELSSLSDSKQQDNDDKNNNDSGTKDSNSMSVKPNQETALDVAYAADQIQQNCCTNKIHKIYREKYNPLIKAMAESQQFCYVTFGEDGGLVQAEADIQINSENRL